MSNKLLEGAPKGKGNPTTPEMLHEIAAKYNAADWTRASGNHWYVAREAKGDGTFHHRLDCTKGAR